MKTEITTDLRDHLRAGGPFIIAELYTITLATGELIHWADFDIDLAHPVNGYTYVTNGPVLKRGRTRHVIGLEVDTMDLSIYPRETDTLNGESLLIMVRRGAFDYAELVLERAFLRPDASIIGTVILFSGSMADISPGRTEIAVRVNSDLEALQVKLPLDTYKPGCSNIHYGPRCGLDRELFVVGAAVAAGSSDSRLVCGLSNPAGWFNRGYIRFISGDLAGTRRTIKSYTPGNLNLFMPLPSVPAIGDLMAVYPGCDRTQATCQAKFNNLGRFRGCPYIPVPETAY